MLCNAKAAAKRSAERKKTRAAKNPVIKENIEWFYKKVWDETPLKECFETGQKLYTYKNWHVHHLLDKKTYPEHKLNPDVCVLLTLEQHALFHSIAPSDLERKMPNCYKKLNELKEKYGYN